MRHPLLENVTPAQSDNTKELICAGHLLNVAGEEKHFQRLDIYYISDFECQPSDFILDWM